MSDINNILKERGKTHGDFTQQAECTQILKSAVTDYGYFGLSNPHKEAIDMILHKIARIMTGDPDVKDHWDDIAGYATLASNRTKIPAPLVSPASS